MVESLQFLLGDLQIMGAAKADARIVGADFRSLIGSASSSETAETTSSPAGDILSKLSSLRTKVSTEPILGEDTPDEFVGRERNVTEFVTSLAAIVTEVSRKVGPAFLQTLQAQIGSEGLAEEPEAVSLKTTAPDAVPFHGTIATRDKSDGVPAMIAAIDLVQRVFQTLVSDPREIVDQSGPEVAVLRENGNLSFGSLGPLVTVPGLSDPELPHAQRSPVMNDPQVEQHVALMTPVVGQNEELQPDASGKSPVFQPPKSRTEIDAGTIRPAATRPMEVAEIRPRVLDVSAVNRLPWQPNLVVVDERGLSLNAVVEVAPSVSTSQRVAHMASLIQNRSRQVGSVEAVASRKTTTPRPPVSIPMSVVRTSGIETVIDSHASRPLIGQPARDTSFVPAAPAKANSEFWAEAAVTSKSKSVKALRVRAALEMIPRDVGDLKNSPDRIAVETPVRAQSGKPNLPLGIPLKIEAAPPISQTASATPLVNSNAASISVAAEVLRPQASSTERQQKVNLTIQSVDRISGKSAAPGPNEMQIELPDAATRVSKVATAVASVERSIDPDMHTSAVTTTLNPARDKTRVLVSQVVALAEEGIAVETPVRAQSGKPNLPLGIPLKIEAAPPISQTASATPLVNSNAASISVAAEVLRPQASSTERQQKVNLAIQSVDRISGKSAAPGPNEMQIELPDAATRVSKAATAVASVERSIDPDMHTSTVTTTLNPARDKTRVLVSQVVALAEEGTVSEPEDFAAWLRPRSAEHIAPSGQEPSSIRHAAEIAPKSETGTSALGRSRFAQAVMTQIQTSELREGRTLVELRPRGLGQVEVDVSTLSDGNLKVTLRADNPIVISALRESREMLIQSLGPNGELSFEDRSAGRDQNRQNAREITNSAGDSDTSDSADLLLHQSTVIGGGQLDIMT